MSDRPVLWSVAGNDSGGGAGLSADARAAEGCAVHLCPVVASITAQNSLGVARVVPVAADVLDAQLAELAADMRPSVIKTGLIGSAEGVAVLRRWLDRLDADGGSRVRLVVEDLDELTLDDISAQEDRLSVLTSIKGRLSVRYMP